MKIIIIIILIMNNNININDVMKVLMINNDDE